MAKISNSTGRAIRKAGEQLADLLAPEALKLAEGVRKALPSRCLEIAKEARSLRRCIPGAEGVVYHPGVSAHTLVHTLHSRARDVGRLLDYVVELGERRYGRNGPLNEPEEDCLLELIQAAR